MRARLASLLSAVPLLASPGAQAQALSPEELYARLAPSVWLVNTFDADAAPLARGSAVVIGPETLLTNCHVLRRANRFTITNDNVTHEGRLQHLDVDRDLCQITARNLHAPAVPLGDSDRVIVGQKVFALGNPRGLERTFSDGMVSALRRTEDQKLAAIQITAPISHGSSGGGVFDAQGRLLGITTAIIENGQNLNFAVPINWLHELAARSEAARKLASAAPVPAPAPAPAPNSAGGRDINDIAAVPVNDTCREEYRKFVVAPPPKAFAVTVKGACAWQRSRTANRPQISSDPDPGVRAMALCRSWYGPNADCGLYAIDNRVVWKR